MKSPFLDTALAAAEAAGEIIRKAYRGKFKVRYKADASPVTEVDEAAEAAIRKILRKKFHGHGFYGEETGQEHMDAEYLWLVDPIVAPMAPALLERHRIQGDTLLIITATNRFVTEPIAKLLDVDELIATDPEQVNGRYSGAITGTPCYREGKVARLAQWRAQQDEKYTHTTFYSDSHNDLPLLRQVDQPIAVDPDDELRAEAARQRWPIISLRETLPSI